MKHSICLFIIFFILIISCSESGLSPDSTDTKHPIDKFINENLWNEFFSGRWGVGDHWKRTYEPLDEYYDNMEDFYSYENFVAAVNELKNKNIDGIDFGHFINKPGATDEEKMRELAAFLANISHETGEYERYPIEPGDKPMGLFYREERYYERLETINNTPAPYTQVDDEFPSSTTKELYPEGHSMEDQVKFTSASYHGRGPIQLSWNYNYGPVSVMIFGDKNILLDKPSILLTNGKYAFMSAIWFWMLPRWNKPSSHEVMYKTFVPNKTTGHQDGWGFGHTITIINGFYEAGKSTNGTDENSKKVARRVTFYDIYANGLNVRIGVDGENVDTLNYTSY